jgi:SAM-dependent methyltransferase
MCRLLDDATLENSWVVANRLMNRERGCVGGNSYAKELGLNPLEFLSQRLAQQKQTAWLDLCCGSGKALIEAARHFQTQRQTTDLHIIGVDLVSLFHPGAETFDFLDLRTANLAVWQPQQQFDLITCVHGLHYLGDKLSLIERVATWLKADGLFIANLDPTNLRYADGAPAGKAILKRLRACGFEYLSRKHLLVLHSQRHFQCGFRYLGADENAGANYTGQPAVNSHYEASAIYPKA